VAHSRRRAGGAEDDQTVSVTVMIAKLVPRRAAGREEPHPMLRGALDHSSRWQVLTSGSARDAASGGSFNDPAFEEGGNAG